MAAFRVVFVTTPVAKAEPLARQILENRLAACVTIAGNVQSLFWWKDKIESEPEAMLVIKTTTKKVEELIKFVRKNHGYEIPEIISVTVAEGNPDYLDWLDRETAG